MARYTKENPRIAVKFINADTDEVLFELNDRNWMNVGEILSVGITDSIMKNHFKNAVLPKNIIIIAVSECTLNDD
jgi:hypothetical protein